MKVLYSSIFQIRSLFLAALLLVGGAAYSQVTLATQVVEDFPNSLQVNLVASNFQNIVGMQFTVEFDPAEAEYLNFSDLNLPGFGGGNISNPLPNKITVSWISPDLVNGTTVPDATVIAKLNFTPLVADACSFLFSQFPTPTEFTDINGEAEWIVIDCAIGSLTGTLAADLNDNCQIDAGENGLPNFKVALQGDNGTYYSVTDLHGNYFFPLPANETTLLASVIPPNGYWDAPCLVNNVIDINGGGNFSLDIPITANLLCTELWVDVSTTLLRRCFDNTYTVSYCNQGTLPVIGVEVTVELDEYLDVLASSIPWSLIEGNTYTFSLGDLEVGECGIFTITANLSCDAVLGQTHCVEAVISPVETCNTSSSWDGSSLSVQGNCDGNEVQFEIRNIGSENMSAPSSYIVIEDDMIKMSEPIDPLNVDQTLNFSFPANGSTWRVEVAQAPFHPGNSQPSATVEGCDTDDDFSTGFVNMFGFDEGDPFVAIDCQQNLGSYDPNDKQGFPAGYRDEHLIAPNTPIEYKIRFQNTGTDTAFTVVVFDTLSTLLDPATLRTGAYSHPYQLDILDGHILKFTFNHILLPDSTTNEPASHGFVQFKIDQQPDVAIGSMIYNDAAIYFDFNDPVITNTTFHRIGIDFIQDVTSAREVFAPGLEVQITPHPIHGEAQMKVFGMELQESTLRLYDGFGRLVRNADAPGNEWTLERESLPAGIYWYTLQSEGRLLATGKLIFQ